MSKKRTSDGNEKSQGATPRGTSDIAPTNQTPPGAQAPQPSNAPAAAQIPKNQPKNHKKQKIDRQDNASDHLKQPPGPPGSQRQKRKKLPKLPPNASITKRPLHHPAIPTPFSSSEHPKTLYISSTTPFVPTLKRIRRLLLEISKRHAQSLASQAPRNRQQRWKRKPLEPNGHLAPADVERQIAEEGKEKGGAAGKGGEEVYVKATGKAIERALKVGVYFQDEGDCKVRVEMGSVMAVDDIELKTEDDRLGDEGACDQQDGDNLVQKKEDEDVPETRVRMVSSVTVAIGLK